jgi:hypothetical protein
MVFPLASRIDASASRLRTVWREGGTLGDDTIEGYQSVFERLFCDLYHLDECKLEDYFNATQIPHDGDYAYGELIAAERDGVSDNLSIGHKCAELARRLELLDAPWEALPESILGPVKEPAPLEYRLGGVLGSQDLYVTRKADEELVEAVRRGEYCSVLADRQTGKSSLLSRAAQRLSAQGFRTAFADLSALGGTSVDERSWWRGLTYKLDAVTLPQEATDIEPDVEFERDLEALAASASTPLVLFLDEIDAALIMPFSDRFLATLRRLFMARERNEALRRLVVVVAGVATPFELLGSPTQTPFNIAKRIELTDFSLEEALILAPTFSENGAARTDLLRRILDWTGGHPYLTHAVCKTLSESTSIDVHGVVASLYLSPTQRDHNILSVQQRVERLPSDQRRRALHLYREVLLGGVIKDDPASETQSVLALSGLIKVKGAHRLLVSRCRIYTTVFDLQWTQARIPAAWWVKSPTMQLSAAALFAVVTWLIQFLFG